MDTIFMLNLAGIVAFGVAVLGFFYMMGKKKREEDRDRKDSAMWQALLVLLVIVLAVALSRGRAGTPFRHHAP